MPINRRDFAKTLGVAAAFVATEVPVQKPSDAQTALVRAEFGSHVTDEEIEKMRKDFADSAPFLQKFREFKLANSDEPDLTFNALVKRW